MIEGGFRRKSFYTFQTLSYTLDVYYKRILPEKHFGYFALYVSFFLQLVAGPIERADKLLPQLKKKQNYIGHMRFKEDKYYIRNKYFPIVTVITKK